MEVENVNLASRSNSLLRHPSDLVLRIIGFMDETISFVKLIEVSLIITFPDWMPFVPKINLVFVQYIDVFKSMNQSKYLTEEGPKIRLSVMSLQEVSIAYVASKYIRIKSLSYGFIPYAYPIC